MNYQVIFKDENGCNITTPVMCERDKDTYLEMLSKMGSSTMFWNAEIRNGSLPKWSLICN